MSLAVLHTEFFSDTYPEEYEAIGAVLPDNQFGSSLEDFATSVVLPRYRAIPFGEDLEKEAHLLGHRLINSWSQHRAIDDLISWAALLGDLTAKTYTLDTFDDAPEGRYFVKGEVNSFKNHGVSSVFAEDKDSAVRLAYELQDHTWLTNQRIVLREVQDYMQLGTDPSRGLPIFNERRVFVYCDTVLAHGFYWDNVLLDVPVPEIDAAFFDGVDAALDAVAHLADFLVVDMAQYTDGHWGVVELNDGCQSGIPQSIDPFDVYSRLAKDVY